MKTSISLFFYSKCKKMVDKIKKYSHNKIEKNGNYSKRKVD